MYKRQALIFVVAIPLLSVVVFGVMVITRPLYKTAQVRLDRVLGLTLSLIHISVKPGDTVTAGQKLGTVGTISCECAEEAHIHLEVLQRCV